MENIVLLFICSFNLFLSTSSPGNGVLSEAIPLPQMVDILIDFWEADGLFD
jgi:hypothetical protein